MPLKMTTMYKKFIITSQISNYTELEMIAQSEVELSPEDLEIFEGLVDALEDDDDVQKVYHNVANL